MEEIKTKICPKCGEEKPLTSEFWYKRSASRDGHGSWCKGCHRNAWIIFAKNNSEYLAQKKKEWVKNNPEKMRQSIAKRKPENLRKAVAKWAKAHPDKVREMRNAWRAKNIDKKRQSCNKCGQKARDTLADRYIKDRIRHEWDLQYDEISFEMIQVKREQIKMRRLINQIKQEAGL